MDILSILYTIVPAALIAATPLLFTALGGLFSERSGIVNIGLEGLMVIGAFSGILATLWFETLGMGRPLHGWLCLLLWQWAQCFLYSMLLPPSHYVLTRL